MVFMTSCGSSFENLLSEGKYVQAEKVLKRMNGDISPQKYDYAEMLIREYIELEEYDKALNVHSHI